MSKKLPKFDSDEAIAEFLEQNDLSEYMTDENLVRARAHFDTVHFEELPKTENVNFRSSAELLQAVKNKAAEQGINYQKFIRKVLTVAVTGGRREPG